MADKNLNIVIGANINSATTGLRNVSKELANTAVAAQKVDSSIGKTSSTSNTATFALTNLGRVAQDLPYGFIGIANNLNPLLESFQRLQKEAKETGQSVLPLLTKSLVGGGGLGLALSAVTAAITFAQIGFTMWGRRTKEAKEETDKFAKSLDDAKAGVLANSTQLQGFIAIARDTTKSLSERNYALKEANRIMGEHGDKLTLVNINTSKVTEQVNTLTQALLNEAIAAKYADKIADLTIRQAEASKAYGKALGDYNREAKTAAELNKLSVSGGTGGVGGLGNVSAINKARVAYNSVTEAAGNYKSVTEELHSVFGDFTAVQTKAVAGFGAIGTKAKDAAGATDKAKKSIETIQDVYNDLQKQLAADNNNPLLNQFTRAQAKIKDIQAAITKMVGLGANRETPEIKELTGELKRLTLFVAPDNVVVSLPSLDSIGDNLTKSLNAKFPDGVPLKIPIKPLFDDLQKKAEAMADNINEVVSSGLAGVGDAIGQALSGKNPFASFLSVLGSGIKSIGEQLLKLGAVAIAAKSALKSLLANPYLAIAAGVAAIALGTVISNKANSIKAFATGGVVTRPTLAMVGEQGPERITPLGQISNSGNNALSGEVVFQISGQTLRGILKRANSSSNNIYGF